MTWGRPSLLYLFSFGLKLKNKKWGHPGFEPGSPASYDCMAITGCFSRPKQAYYHYTNDPNRMKLKVLLLI